MWWVAAPAFVMDEESWVDHTYESSQHDDIKAGSDAAYPKISRPSVEVQIKSLCRRTDAHRSEVKRVVLHVFCSNFSSITSLGTGLLLEDHLCVRSATIKGVDAIFAPLMDLVSNEVGTLFGGLEGIFLQEPDI